MESPFMWVFGHAERMSDEDTEYTPLIPLIMLSKSVANPWIEILPPYLLPLVLKHTTRHIHQTAFPEMEIYPFRNT